MDGVLSDIAGIAVGSARSSLLIIKDIRHRDNSPRQIAGSREIEEVSLPPIIPGCAHFTRKPVTKHFQAASSNCRMRTRRRQGAVSGGRCGQWMKLGIDGCEDFGGRGGFCALPPARNGRGTIM